MRWSKLTYSQRMQMVLWLHPLLPALALFLVPRIAGGDVLGKGDEKEAKRREDVARQTEESQTILDQFLAQLIPGSEEYNRLQTEGINLVRSTAGAGDQQDQIRQLGSQYVTQQQARIASGGPATAQQAATMAREQKLRDVAAFTPEEQSVFSALRGLGLEGQQQPTGIIFADLVARAQDPDKYYTSTMKQKLDLLSDQVKARAAQRGILGSGLELENLGRTGSELAIREADAQEAFRQQQLANFQSLFNVGQGLRGREIGLEGDLVNLQLGRESRLTDLLSQNTNLRLNDVVNLLEHQTGQATDDRLDAEDTVAARKGVLGKTIGAGLGAAAGTVLFPGLGTAAGAKLGADIGGGFGGGDVGSLLGEQRTATTSAGTPTSVPLSRSPQSTGQLSPAELAALLSKLGMS